MNTHEMVEILQISDDPQKLAALLAEEAALQARVEQVEAENGRLAAELAAARELLVDLEWSRSDRYENERCPICAGKSGKKY